MDNHFFNAWEFPPCEDSKISAFKLNLLNNFVSNSHMKNIKKYNVIAYLFYESFFPIREPLITFPETQKHKSLLPSLVMRHIKCL